MIKYGITVSIVFIGDDDLVSVAVAGYKNPADDGQYAFRGAKLRDGGYKWVPAYIRQYALHELIQRRLRQ